MGTEKNTTPEQTTPEQTTPEHSAPEQSAKEIALEQLLNEMRESNKTRQETIKELKVQNEKLLLLVNAGTEQKQADDGELFSIFNKYEKNKK